MIYLKGDIVSIDDRMYLSGKIDDTKKLEFQIYDYDPVDKLYQIRYFDDRNTTWRIWVPIDEVKFRYSYNFWLKRKKLLTKLKDNIFNKSDILSEERTKF